MGKNKTPLIRQLRTQGGTIYTFSSATEDIGLNINEKGNKVALSHYALLNIPVSKTDDNLSDISKNRFNISMIPGALYNMQESQTVSSPNILIAESFQNYALNLETILLNQSTYNYSLSKTVSERVFWKWLKETGAIRWEYNKSNGYWTEPINEEGYSQVVQCYGEIFTGAQRSDTFGMYNETYIKVPTSYGQTLAYFKTNPDINYSYNMILTNTDNNNEFIVGQDNDVKPNGLSVKAYYDTLTGFDSTPGNEYNLKYQNDQNEYVQGWWYTKENIPFTSDAYLTDTSINLEYVDDASINTILKYESMTGGASYSYKRSNLDCVSLELGLNNLRSIYSDESLTYDTLAINNSISNKFSFNAVLIYYSIYDSDMKNILATNLFGILFLDSPVSNSVAATGATLDFYIPTFIKDQSTTNGFGTAYSFRLNIKTSSIYDNTDSPIYDESTSESLITDDFNDVVYNLNKSIEILGKNTNLVNTISNNYLTIKNQVLINTNKLSEIEKNINNILGNSFSYLSLDSLTSNNLYVNNITPSNSSTINIIFDNNIIGNISSNGFTYNNFTGGGFTSNSYIRSLGNFYSNNIFSNNNSFINVYINTTDNNGNQTSSNNFRFNNTELISKDYVSFNSEYYNDSQMIGGNGYGDINIDDLINELMNINVGEFKYKSLFNSNDSSHYGIDITTINGKYLSTLKSTKKMPWMQNNQDYNTLNYIELIPLLLKAIQYLYTKINN